MRFRIAFTCVLDLPKDAYFIVKSVLKNFHNVKQSCVIYFRTIKLVVCTTATMYDLVAWQALYNSTTLATFQRQQKLQSYLGMR